jgi:PAS domain S-box-containing protein
VAPPALKLLLIEDSPTDALLLQNVLETDHLSTFAITHVERLAEGLERIQQEEFDIILLDLGLPDSSGLATFERLQGGSRDIPIVAFSGNLDESDAIQAVRSGAQDYLVKNMGGFEMAARTIRYAIERQRNQSALQKSEERFYRAFHDSPVAQAITRLSDQKLISVNEAYCRLTGFTQEQLIGQTTQDLNFRVHSAYRDSMIQPWETDGHSRDVEVEFRTSAGEECILLTSSQSIEINGESCMISTALDITERKRAEVELRLYAEIMTNISEGIVLVRKHDMSIVYANPKFEEMFGYEEGELIGKNISIVNAPTDKSPEEAAHEIENALRETDSWSGEVCNRRKTGETFWCYGSISSFDHPRYGKVWISAQRDITSRKQAEERLRQSEANYRLLSEELEIHVQQRTAEVQDLYDNAPTGYHSLDAQGRFTQVNQTEQKWLGYRREELIGHLFTDFVTASSLKTFLNNFPLFKQLGRINNLEFEMIRKDGTTFPVLVNATGVYDSQGNYLMSRSTVIDNTERKKAEIALLMSRDELRIAYAALEKASHAKDEFLANMSHELRTPLNGILGMSEILLEGLRGPLNERQQKLVHAIEDSGNHLLSLINDVLDLSKIEAGQLEIHPEMISLNKACMDSLAFVRESAMKKGLVIDFQSDPAATTILADERHLKQILINLLNNAIKFTSSPGKVILAVQANRAQGSIDLSVSDTGIGISADDLQRLFQPFTQVDSSLSRRHEGTGLGLALVKRLTELHGGGISVTSEIGQGSCFTVSLPWQEGQVVQADRSSADTETIKLPPGDPLRTQGTVLLAEDTETNILTMGDYLESVGFKLVYARTGHEALIQAAEYFPDVILMDIQMPEMDGLEATRRLRSDQRFANTPIIAVTALLMPGDRERCLEAGATAYISKPVQLKMLANLIRDFLSQR